MESEHSEIELIESGDLTFASIDPALPFEVESLEKIDAVIIHYNDEKHVIDCIFKIRKSHQILIYLKPIFIYKEKGEISAAASHLADGVTRSVSELDEVIDITRKLHSRTRSKQS